MSHLRAGYRTEDKWSDFHFRRRVAASLVKSVYELERQRCGNGIEDCSHRWKSFNFQLNQELINPKDGTIFGAVFKWDQTAAEGCSQPEHVPQIVVALRGTLFKSHSIQQDILDDFRILTNTLDDENCRFLVACKAVESNKDANNIWIVGHSLGAEFGMLLGKKFAVHDKLFLNAHLFNPPFVSAAISKCKGLNSVLHITRDMLTVLLANHLQHLGKIRPSENAEDFVDLDSWVPTLYINRSDPICSAYVEYFDTQKFMRLCGFRDFSDQAGAHCFRSLLLSFLGKDNKMRVSSIPSAVLLVNNEPMGLPESHTIDQWLSQDISANPKTHELLSLDNIDKLKEKCKTKLKKAFSKADEWLGSKRDSQK